MSEESQTKLAEAHAMLAEAARLNDNGEHGEALKQAYHTSEQIAVVYLSTMTGQSLPSNDTNYDLFAETIREPHRHPALVQKVGEVVGKVCALREAYEPALLDETSLKDAQQMIGHVAALAELVDEILKSR
jgi:hypothetical protein